MLFYFSSLVKMIYETNWESDSADESGSDENESDDRNDDNENTESTDESDADDDSDEDSDADDSDTSDDSDDDSGDSDDSDDADDSSNIHKPYNSKRINGVDDRVDVEMQSRKNGKPSLYVIVVVTTLALIILLKVILQFIHVKSGNRVRKQMESFLAEESFS